MKFLLKSDKEKRAKDFRKTKQIYRKTIFELVLQGGINILKKKSLLSTCKVVVRKLFVDTMSTKKSLGISIS